MAQKTHPSPLDLPAGPAQTNLSIIETSTESIAPAGKPETARAAAPSAVRKKAARPAGKTKTKPVARLSAKPASRIPSKAATAVAEKPAPRGAATAESGRSGYLELSDLGRLNAEACAACGAIMGKGMEAIGKEVVAFAQSSLEANFAAAESLLRATSLREALDLQVELQKRSLDRMLDESAKLTGLSFGLAGEVIEPVRESLDRATRTLLKPLAA